VGRESLFKLRWRDRIARSARGGATSTQDCAHEDDKPARLGRAKAELLHRREGRLHPHSRFFQQRARHGETDIVNTDGMSEHIDDAFLFLNSRALVLYMVMYHIENGKSTRGAGQLPKVVRVRVVLPTVGHALMRNFHRARN